jgi:putative transcriptional regulator
MSKLSDDIIEGLTEALAHASGKETGARVTTFHVPDVRAIRENLHMSQSEFADAYQIPLTTLQGWEQGRRNPDRTAAAYLSVIARMPTETRSALQL